MIAVAEAELPDDLFEEIEAWAQDHGWTFDQALQLIVLHYLRHQIEPQLESCKGG